MKHKTGWFGRAFCRLTGYDLDPEDEATREYIRAWIATGRRDFNIGYALSFALVVAMIVLSVNVPSPDAFHPSRTWTVYYVFSLLAVLAFGVMGAAVRLNLVPELVRIFT